MQYRIPAERMVMPIKCVWFDSQLPVCRLRYLRFLWVIMTLRLFIYFKLSPHTISKFPMGYVGPMLGQC